jgi:hypothetical protein
MTSQRWVWIGRIAGAIGILLIALKVAISHHLLWF